jgi:hypothetical protein
MAEQHDATLMVQLAQWGASMGLEDALEAIWSPDFDPDNADPQDRMVRRVLTFGETIGTLTKNGLLDTALVTDWLWVAGLWGRVGSAATKMRAELGVAELYENFEALAAQQS